MSNALETISLYRQGAVLTAEMASPPLNLLGPELIRDIVSVIQDAEGDSSLKVLVFKSADPDYFIAHVDVMRIGENREAAVKLTGEASLGLLFRHISASRLITIAQIEGRTGGAGSEFALACDMRFAARESAIFRHMEPALGTIEGAGGVQHLTRLMGRGRALEVLLSAEDYDADLAERYGWINRALPAAELEAFVTRLAQRISRFPSGGLGSIKGRINEIALASPDDYRRDSSIFLDDVRKPAAQARIQAAMKRGFQSREAELSLPTLLGELPVFD